MVEEENMKTEIVDIKPEMDVLKFQELSRGELFIFESDEHKAEPPLKMVVLNWNESTPKRYVYLTYDEGTFPGQIGMPSETAKVIRVKQEGPLRFSKILQ